MGTQAVPVLLRLCNGGESKAQLVANEIYGMGAGVGPALVAALGDRDEFVRGKAGGFLVDLHRQGGNVIPLLLEALADRGEFLANYAGLTLGVIGTDAIEDVRKLISDKDTDASSRLFAVLALAQMGPKAKPALAVLSEALVNSDKGVRQIALLAVGRMGRDGWMLLREVTDRLYDVESDVRCAAPEALEKIGVPHRKVLLALREVGESPDVDTETRRNAAIVHNKFIDMLNANIGEVAEDFYPMIPNLERALAWTKIRHNHSPDVA